MGNIRRIKRSMGSGSQVILADTGIKFNERQVLLAVKSRDEGLRLAKGFAAFVKLLTFRANQVNMGDFYTAHIRILEKVSGGLSLVN